MTLLRFVVVSDNFRHECKSFSFFSNYKINNSKGIGATIFKFQREEMSKVMRTFTCQKLLICGEKLFTKTNLAGTDELKSFVS